MEQVLLAFAFFCFAMTGAIPTVELAKTPSLLEHSKTREATTADPDKMVPPPEKSMELLLTDLSLPPEVISEALFSQVDNLQDLLEQCEETVRNQLTGNSLNGDTDNSISADIDDFFSGRSLNSRPRADNHRTSTPVAAADDGDGEGHVSVTSSLSTSSALSSSSSSSTTASSTSFVPDVDNDDNSNKNNNNENDDLAIAEGSTEGEDNTRRTEIDEKLTTHPAGSVDGHEEASGNVTLQNVDIIGAGAVENTTSIHAPVSKADKAPPLHESPEGDDVSSVEQQKLMRVRRSEFWDDGKTDVLGTSFSQPGRSRSWKNAWGRALRRLRRHVTDSMDPKRYLPLIQRLTDRFTYLRHSLATCRALLDHSLPTY